MTRTMMKPLMREEMFPATFRRLMENFWNADRFFDDEFVKGEFMPAVNIKENKKDFEIEVAAPGMKRDDFKVTVENGVLCIAAERREEKKEEEDNFTRREFFYNKFQRSFTLPENVEEKNIVAKYEDGILRLMLKKMKPVEPEVKKIEIK